jgi:hypothetical protein
MQTRRQLLAATVPAVIALGALGVAPLETRPSQIDADPSVPDGTNPVQAPPFNAFAAPGECPILHDGDSLQSWFADSKAGVHAVEVRVVTVRRWKRLSADRRREWTAFRIGDTQTVICVRMVPPEGC